MPDNIIKSLYTYDYYRSFDQWKKNKGQILTQLIKKFYSKNYIKTGTVILDIGCGRGDLIFHLSKNGWSIYGLDYSENALSFAKETIRPLLDNIRKKIRLLCADACRLPFKNNTIDFICSIDVFEHLRDNELKSLVKEMYRVLKKKGRFIIFTSPNKEYADIGYRYWIKPINIIFNPISKTIFKKQLMTVDHYSEPTHINLLSVKSLQRLFAAEDFEVHIYTRWFLPDNFIGYIYKVISQLWPITLFYPMRNLFCPYLWVEGEKIHA